jgi:hypothetical protein
LLCEEKTKKFGVEWEATGVGPKDKEKKETPWLALPKKIRGQFGSIGRRRGSVKEKKMWVLASSITLGHSLVSRD